MVDTTLKALTVVEDEVEKYHYRFVGRALPAVGTVSPRKWHTTVRHSGKPRHGVTAFPGCHEGSGSTLDRVGSGFIHRLPRGGNAQWSRAREDKTHQRTGHIEAHHVVCLVEHCQCRRHRGYDR